MRAVDKTHSLTDLSVKTKLVCQILTIMSVLISSAGFAAADKSAQQSALASEQDQVRETGVLDSIELPLLYSKPTLKRSEYQETVPGIFTTQEYGPGTAGNVYLRGEFLPYGAGLKTTLDDMPISMRQNAMGNGYTDMNIIIPELIDRVDYVKGPYSLKQGDASPAGAVGYRTVNALDKSLLQLAIGQDFFFRMVAADSENWMGGKFLYAADISGFDNAWATPDEDEERLTSYFKQSWEQGNEAYGFSFYGMRNNWNSPTPVPDREVATGRVNEFDSITFSDNGKSRLAGINGFWEETSEHRKKSLNAYFYSSEIRLVTNNTYAAYDPVQGDQFLQIDLRNVIGISSEYSMQYALGDQLVDLDIGAQFQNDNIRNAGLFHVKDDEVLDRINQDEIAVRSLGVYASNVLKITRQLTATINLRDDFYIFNTKSSIAANSNSVTDSHPSEHLLFDYQFDAHILGFANIGKSYSSNSVQEINNTIDPLSGAALTRKSPFNDVMQTELGFKYRGTAVALSLTMWQKKSDAETVYSPTTNTTMSSRSSKRKGIDTTAIYQHNPYSSVNLSLSLSDAKYDAIDNSITSPGTEIINAPSRLAGLDFRYTPASGYFAVLTTKYIGKRPLNESGSVTTGAVTLTNLRIGKRWKDVSMHMEFLNLLNSDAKEINNLYTSQLSSESSAVEDNHYRVLSPFTYRFFMTHDFR